ncbi:hypothetical protein IPM19_00015 [bacterium]|nr:MAG: hypothetical protein IPM19_00015 [bacterium]
MKANLIAILMILFLPTLALAQNMNSTNYQVEGGTFDGGGESSSSTNYTSRESIGDLSSEGSNSTNFNIFAGFIRPAYPGVPGTPTLVNTGGTMYDSLDFVVSTGVGQQSDTMYAIAISTDDFATTNFIQADDTVGPNEAWQTYTSWGGGSGETVVGLTPGLTYKIKVKASYGSGSDAGDTETGYSQTASATTAGPNLSITFLAVGAPDTVDSISVDTDSTTNAIAYGSLSVNVPKIAAHGITVTTNATAGYATTLLQDGHLRTGSGLDISAVSGTNASPAAWPGSVTTGAFGYHASDDTLCTGTSGRFVTTNTYAALTTSPEEVACSAGPVTSETNYVIFKLEIGNIQPSGNYQNIVTYITTAQF